MCARIWIKRGAPTSLSLLTRGRCTRNARPHHIVSRVPREKPEMRVPVFAVRDTDNATERGRAYRRIFHINYVCVVKCLTLFSPRTLRPPHARVCPRERFRLLTPTTLTSLPLFFCFDPFFNVFSFLFFFVVISITITIINALGFVVVFYRHSVIVGRRRLGRRRRRRTSYTRHVCERERMRED